MLYGTALFSQQLSRLVDEHACGLDFIYRYTKITNRDSSLFAANPGPKGTPLPIEYEITELPESSCSSIMDSYIWFVIAETKYNNSTGIYGYC